MISSKHIESFYTSNAALPSLSFPPLNHDLSVDVAIIGGGLSGITCRLVGCDSGLNNDLSVDVAIIGGGLSGIKYRHVGGIQYKHIYILFPDFFPRGCYGLFSYAKAKRSLCLCSRSQSYRLWCIRSQWCVLRGWCGTLKMVVWYFEEGGVVL